MIYHADQVADALLADRLAEQARSRGVLGNRAQRRAHYRGVVGHHAGSKRRKSRRR